MRRIFLVLLACFVPMQAQEEEGAAKKATLANINAVVVFTSKDGLNSGYYDFTRANTTMAVLHLYDRYQFGTFSPHFNVFLAGGVGYSRTWMTNELPPATPAAATDTGLTLSNMLQTYTGELGGGVRYVDDTGIEWSAGFNVIYSRVRFTNFNKTHIGEIIGNFFDGNYNDNLTYRFYLLSEYVWHAEGFVPYIKLSYNLYETKSGFSVHELKAFTSQSGVLSLMLGTESPPLVRSGSEYLTLEGYLWGSWLGGDLSRVAGFDGYGTLGATAYWYMPKRWPFIRRFFADVSTIRADGLRGYNLGFGFSVAY